MLASREDWLDQVSPRTVCVAHGGVLRAIFRLTETLSPVECAALSIPQDRVLRFVDNWIGSDLLVGHQVSDLLLAIDRVIGGTSVPISSDSTSNRQACRYSHCRG